MFVWSYRGSKDEPWFTNSKSALIIAVFDDTKASDLSRRVNWLLLDFVDVESRSSLKEVSLEKAMTSCEKTSLNSVIYFPKKERKRIRQDSHKYRQDIQ